MALRPGADAFAAAGQAVVFAMIETRDGLDGLFVGPGDLGLSLGLGLGLGLGPGQDRDEPEMRERFARVVTVCREVGKRAAIHAGSMG